MRRVEVRLAQPFVASDPLVVIFDDKLVVVKHSFGPLRYVSADSLDQLVLLARPVERLSRVRQRRSQNVFCDFEFLLALARTRHLDHFSADCVLHAVRWLRLRLDLHDDEPVVDVLNHLLLFLHLRLQLALDHRLLFDDFA